jgi:hypothetical protein
MRLIITKVLLFLMIASVASTANAIIHNNDKIALLQLHRFNQLQMQMAMMVKDKTRKEEVLELVNKVYTVHKEMNNDVSKLAGEVEFDLAHVPKGLERKAKSEYRDEFVSVAQKIQEAERKEINELYPEWVKKTHMAMYIQLKDKMDELNSPMIQKLFREKMKKIAKNFL